MTQRLEAFLRALEQEHELKEFMETLLKETRPVCSPTLDL